MEDLATSTEIQSDVSAVKAKVDGAKWYIVNVVPGMEKRAKRTVLENAEKRQLAEFIVEVIVPTVEVQDIRRGAIVNVEKKITPGYVLFNIVPCDAVFQLIQSVNEVKGFLGMGGKPQHVTEQDIQSIFREMESKTHSINADHIYQVGQSVKVTHGPFESFVGVIESVDLEKKQVVVSIPVFDRTTPVNLSFNHVKRNIA